MNSQTCGPDGITFSLREPRHRRDGEIPSPQPLQDALCPPLRPEQAAQLSAAFLRDTTESIAAAAVSAPIVGYAAGGEEGSLKPPWDESI